MGERVKIWFGVALVGFILASAAIEQFTSGKYPIPALLVDLAKVAIPALFVADGLTEAGRVLSNRRNGRNDPPPSQAEESPE